MCARRHDLRAITERAGANVAAVGREAALWRAVHQGMAERLPSLLTHRETVALVEEQRLHGLLPHLDRSELRFRHAATLAAIGSLRTGTLQPLWPQPENDARLLELVVAWVAGGLRAPAAPWLQT